jgi:hypothetical protein
VSVQAMRHLNVLLMMCTIAACSRSDVGEPVLGPTKREQSAKLTSESADGGKSSNGSSTQTGAAEGASAPDAGERWVSFAYKNEVPACAFAEYEQFDKAPFFKDVKQTVTLRAKVPVVFGVYGFGCASPDCVRRPTLQCWTEVEGKTIKVESRYSGEQRVGATCTTQCEQVTADCATPELAPGTYTVQYGAQTTKLKVPGTFRPSCLGSEQPPAAK